MKLKKIAKNMESEMNISLKIKKKGEKINVKVKDIPSKYEDREIDSIYNEDGDLVIGLKKKKEKKLNFTGDGSVEDSIIKMEKSLKMINDDNVEHKKEKTIEKNPSRRIESEKHEILKDFAESKLKAAKELEKKKKDEKEIEKKLSNSIEAYTDIEKDNAESEE